MKIKEIPKDNWDKLEPQSRANLEQADLLFDLFDLSDDYSPAVLPLFKALERELYKICVKKYYEWAETAENITDSRFDYINKILNNVDSFALGRVVRLIIADYNTDNNIYKIKNPFKNFLNTLPSAKNGNKIANKITQICEEIDRSISRMEIKEDKDKEEIIALKEYRNRCAHGLNIINVDDASDCLYRVPQIINDLMEIFYN